MDFEVIGNQEEKAVSQFIPNSFANEEETLSQSKEGTTLGDAILSTLQNRPNSDNFQNFKYSDNLSENEKQNTEDNQRTKLINLFKDYDIDIEDKFSDIEEKKADSDNYLDNLPKLKQGAILNNNEEEIDEDLYMSEKMKEINETLKLAHNKAEDIVEKARNEAEQILAEAKAKLKFLEEEVRTNAEREGFSKGYEDGTLNAKDYINKQLSEERTDFLNTVSGFIDHLPVVKEEIQKQHIEDLTDLALNVAEKITKISLESSSDVIKGMILDAIDDMDKCQWIRIYVSKYDIELLKEVSAELTDRLSELSDNVRVTVMEDAELGTAIVETNEQVLDLSISTQFDNIRDIIDKTI